MILPAALAALLPSMPAELRAWTEAHPEVALAAAASQSRTFEGPIRVPPEEWVMPRGAFRKDGGPI